MADDPHWLRETARKWRELASVCDSPIREQRLRLAESMEEMAAKEEAKRR